MFLTRKLAASVNYILFVALIYNGEKKNIFLMELDFVRSMSTKIKFILIHNFPTIIINC